MCDGYWNSTGTYDKSEKSKYTMGCDVWSEKRDTVERTVVKDWEHWYVEEIGKEYDRDEGTR